MPVSYLPAPVPLTQMLSTAHYFANSIVPSVRVRQERVLLANASASTATGSFTLNTLPIGLV